MMCSKCHKRVAVVFVTKIENGETVNEGFCLPCANKLGIKPINDMLSNMGITGQDLDRLSSDVENLMEALPAQTDNGVDGGAPAVDLFRIFNQGGGEGKKTNAEAKKPKEEKFKFLSAYCRDLNKAAKDGKLDTIVGRKRELDRVIQILCRRQKNNPCLIGEPGVGKTAIAEALAQRIVAGDVPYKLKNAHVWLMDLTALVAGTQFRGQFESRVLGLINEVKAAGNIILVIDEVHNIVGAGDAEGSMNAANIMKPALSRGDIQVIGATTMNEYRKFIEKDTALERRFQPVTVNEPSFAETLDMLRGIKHYYEEYHFVKLPEEVLRLAVTLSERYITDRYLPDKAIDLIDEAASHISLSSDELNELRRLRDEQRKLGEEREKCESMPDTSEEEQEKKYAAIAELKTKDAKLTARLAELERACDGLTVTTEDLAEVIEIWTGVPASTITENEFDKIDKLEARLKEKIIGQDKAVSAVARAVKRNRAGVSYKRKPVSFIFAGPTGVGKTELVKRLAADLFDSPETLIRLDMSEYMEKHSVSRIIGSPPGYVGYDEAGQLTEKIRRRPYSVILFDEIEKAHKDVLNVLLQILDDGRITDSHGKTVNFENTIIVMTTNAGSESGAAVPGFTSGGTSGSDERTSKALASFLRPEFINRVDEVITFRSLDEDDFVKIASLMLDELKDALAERAIAFSYTADAAAFIAHESFSVKFGARNMRRYIQTHVEDPLANLVIASRGNKISNAYLTVEDGKLCVASSDCAIGD
ncbi:MAG: ATP-dependent Clp protease ATP-binding subunit [Ruminococcaceae bacterium]|nr:ATP-dependent Clp protease ATP-binding subunit [Oscillospiraceae bacterium]